MEERFDVAIVGAGPTGLVLANLLGQAGVATIVIEANAATVGEPRAVSIDDETLRVVQQMELLEPVTREIVSGYGSEYLGPDRSIFLRVKPVRQPYGHPRRNAFRQPVFEAQLRAGLARHRSVETRFETRVVGFEQGPDGVDVDLRPFDGSMQRVRARFLVGCDGSWSATREALGYTLVGSSMDERWLIVDLERSPAASPETVVFCDPRRPGIMLPGPRDTRRFEFKLLPGEADADLVSEATVAELLRRHGVDPATPVVRKTVYHFHARIADHWGRNRVWLAGDAAHLMPPFAGQGMNGGVRDAANLAWKLDSVVGGRLGPKLLDTYERERRGHIAEMIRLAMRMGAIFGPRSRWHGLAIRSFFRLLGIWPAARSWFAEMKYKPPPRFDGGFLLTGQLTRRGIVGRMLPQPPLPSSYGSEARLDDLLGTGFCLLGIGIAPEVVHSTSLGAKWDDLTERRISLSAAEVPALADHAGTMLLVRPDRYVMARFSPDEVGAIVPRLDRLAASTWSQGAEGEPRNANV